MDQVQTAPMRVDWVDYAKGICIVLVVMMHSTLGVEKAFGVESYLGSFIAWAQPFRMPDFFLLSGLFLSRRIAMPWAGYVDKKVVHFLYFYVIWMSIQLALKSYGIVQAEGLQGLANSFAFAFIEPFGTLWFIYLLPVFFVVTKVLRKVPGYVIFTLAAVLEILPIHTGWILIDEFAARYVYFFAGYWAATHIFTFANDMNSLSKAGLISALTIWAIVHSQVLNSVLFSLPGTNLTLGFFGSAAVITAGVLLMRLPLGNAIRYLGENSIVIYLSFFIFMAGSRVVAIKFMPWLGVDAIAVGVTLAGIVGPLVLMWLTSGTWARYLFKRPAWAKLPSMPRVKLETEGKVWHAAPHDTAQPNSRPLPR
jgi:uncharacterized membrane protein YcfT